MPCSSLVANFASIALLAVALCLSMLVAPDLISAQTARGSLAGSANQFAVPAALRGRVDFWIDIFARHGRYEVVMHHRLYPQAIFARLDFRQESESMSDVALERHRKATIAALSARVLSAIRSLSAGGGASNEFEERVEKAMRLVPGNAASKYQDILADPELIRTQTGIRERYGQAIQRAGRYLPSIERIFVEEYRLPVELTRLPFIESSFDYKAYSSVGAAGIWQFMRRTGSHYLTINKAVDERRDPIRATHAAAAYLSTAYARLGSWPLAITSYNHGVAGVARKVRAFGSTDIVQLIERPGDKPFGFASSNFYPEFLAAIEVWERRAELFPEFRPERPAQYRVEIVNKSASAPKLAQIYGVELEQLKELNYALMEPVWKGKLAVPAGFKLRVPMIARQKVAVIEPAAPEGPAEEVSRPGAESDKVAVDVPVSPGLRDFNVATYRVRKGDTLAAISKRYGVPLNRLVQANGGSEDIHVGQLLPIPRVVPTPSNTTVHVVVAGDTLHSIAKRNKTSVGKIRELNKLSSTRLRVGQRLVIGGS